MAEVVILGAGLTGLSVAYHLEGRNYRDYSIFEQDDRPGGLLKTEACNGFSFDYTGHYLHVSDLYFRQFLDDVSGLDANFDLIRRKSSIFLLNKYLQYPFQRNLHGLPASVIYDCVNGFINRKIGIKHPSNFHDWVLKYFGSGIGKHFFYPYNSKLLSYNLKKVLPSWTGRFVPQTDLKSILYGALESSLGAAVGYNHFFYYPKHGGIEFLIKSLTSKLENQVKTKHKVVSVDLKNKAIDFENGHSEKYKYLVSTIPLKHMLGLVTNCSSKNYAQQSEKLVCTSIINFNMGFRRDFIGDDHWTYFPEAQFPFYRLGFWHNVSMSTVQANSTGIYGETSFIHGTKTQRQINNLAQKSVASALKYLKIPECDVLASKTMNIEYAYVIYDSWREKNLKKLLNDMAAQQIYSAGRFGEWIYSSMQEAVLSGRAVAEAIFNNLKVLQSDQSMITRLFENNEVKRITPKNLIT